MLIRARACPNCAQTVHVDAKRCQHCRKRLQGSALGPVILIFVTVVCIGIAARRWDFVNDAPRPSRTVPHLVAPKPMVAMEEYEAITTGMTYLQLEEIIGFKGTEVVSTSMAGYDGQIYSWSNPDGSSITAQFQNGALITKAQFGLK